MTTRTTTVAPPGRRARGGGPRARRARLAAARARHPEWWTAAIAVACWALLLRWLLVERSSPHHAPDTAGGPGAVAVLGATIVMAGAMVLPGFVPRVRETAFRAVGRVRHRAIAATTAGFLTVWVGALVAVHVAWSGLAALSSSVAEHRPFRLVLVAVLWCGAWWWQIGTAKQRALRACHRVPKPSAPGLAHDLARVRAGTAYGGWCLVACGPVMVVMVVRTHAIGSAVVAPAAPLLAVAIMVALTVGLAIERAADHPADAARRVAAVVAACAVVDLATLALTGNA